MSELLIHHGANINARDMVPTSVALCTVLWFFYSTCIFFSFHSPYFWIDWNDSSTLLLPEEQLSPCWGPSPSRSSADRRLFSLLNSSNSSSYGMFFSSHLYVFHLHLLLRKVAYLCIMLLSMVDWSPSICCWVKRRFLNPDDRPNRSRLIDWDHIFFFLGSSKHLFFSLLQV